MLYKIFDGIFPNRYWAAFKRLYKGDDQQRSGMGARAPPAVLQRGAAAAGAHGRLPRRPQRVEQTGASGLVASADD